MDVSSASDVVAIFSLPLTVIATIAAAVAAWFAGKAINDSTKQRKQDLRFMYAQRAVKLSDILKLHYRDIDNIDQQLEFSTTSVTHLAMSLGLPLDDLLHEAKVCESLAQAIGEDAAGEMARLLELLNCMKLEHTRNIESTYSAMSADRKESEVWMNAYSKREKLKKSKEEKNLFQNSFSALTQSIQDAYKVKH
ncbi:hypothetical protein HZU72_17660 [Halomonas sp. QX-2]|uniref:Uncharacterized protein n=1 Tax=Vreelandella sedimenti TaxID=2729618 RepID=A0A7Z0SPR7_9GAMM|nr:hypothetical protein [Halomonas sedimenti]NYT74241.1 hypothetical protein [Halomonas sedimenti]